MIQRASRQHGMTLISFLALVVLVGFNILLGLKLAPVYLEHFKVKTSLENLKNEPEVRDMSSKEILAMLQKRWDINGIDRITTKDNATAEVGEGSVIVQVQYEVEQPILSNVSALVKFDDSVTIGK